MKPIYYILLWIGIQLLGLCVSSVATLAIIAPWVVFTSIGFWPPALAAMHFNQTLEQYKEEIARRELSHARSILIK